MATSPIASSPLAEAASLHASKSDMDLTLRRSKKSLPMRVRRETDISHSSSSSASDLSGHHKKEPRSLGFIPISQEDDELLESGGMFTLEVRKSMSVTVVRVVSSH